MGEMKKMFIEQRVKAHEEATNNIVDEIAKVLEKLTIASTDQGKLLKLITEEILTLKEEILILKNRVDYLENKDNLENKDTHA